MPVKYQTIPNQKVFWAVLLIISLMLILTAIPYLNSTEPIADVRITANRIVKALFNKPG